MEGMGKMKGAGKYKDPVCGMSTSPEDAKVTIPYQGIEYYFCSDDCAKKFNRNPEKYIKKTEHEHMKMGDKMGHKGHHGGCGCG